MNGGMLAQKGKTRSHEGKSSFHLAGSIGETTTPSYRRQG